MVDWDRLDARRGAWIFLGGPADGGSRSGAYVSRTIVFGRCPPAATRSHPPATVPPRRRTCFAGRLRIVATNMSMLSFSMTSFTISPPRVSNGRMPDWPRAVTILATTIPLFAIVADGRDLPLEVFFVAHGRADVADGPGWSSFGHELSPCVRVAFPVGGTADGRQGDDSYLGWATGIKWWAGELSNARPATWGYRPCARPQRLQLLDYQSHVDGRTPPSVRRCVALTRARGRFAVEIGFHSVGEDARRRVSLIYVPFSRLLGTLTLRRQSGTRRIGVALGNNWRTFCTGNRRYFDNVLDSTTMGGITTSVAGLPMRSREDIPP